MSGAGPRPPNYEIELNFSGLLIDTLKSGKKTAKEAVGHYLTDEDANVAQKTMEEEEKLFEDLASAIPTSSTQRREFVNGNNDKYEISKRLGSGAYGNVYKVYQVNGKVKTPFAMKVLKRPAGTPSPVGVPQGHGHRDKREFMREVGMLLFLNHSDKQRYSLGVMFMETFSMFGHICILLELLGPTVKDLLVTNFRRGFKMDHVRKIAYQLCSATHFLHGKGLVHHDIKPDNIAFLKGDFTQDPRTGEVIMNSAEIRLIDFGSMVFCYENRTKTATTRQYRSPELGLHLGWNFVSDVWSIGCTVFEIFTGDVFLNCDNEAEKYIIMETVLGETIPPSMTINSPLKCFDETGHLMKTSADAQRLVKNTPRFDLRFYSNLRSKVDLLNMDVARLYNMLRKMLTINPKSRITSQEAMSEEFFTKPYGNPPPILNRTLTIDVAAMKGGTGTISNGTETARAGAGADAANSAMGTAKSAAGNAKSAAGTAKSAAGTAKSAAGTAKSTAGTAKSAAGTAKSATGNAKSAAGTAKSAAGTAKKAVYPACV